MTVGCVCCHHLISLLRISVLTAIAVLFVYAYSAFTIHGKSNFVLGLGTALIFLSQLSSILGMLGTYLLLGSMPLIFRCESHFAKAIHDR